MNTSTKLSASQKGLAPIYLLVGLVVLAVTLLAPIPYYQGPIVCDPPCSSRNAAVCPPCPKPGWYLDDPLWKKVFDYFYYINKMPEKGGVLITITPLPTPSSNPESTNSAKITDWKIYTNKAFGYSLKFPPDWEFPQQYVYGEVPESNNVLISSPDAVGTGQYPDKPNPNHLTISVYVLDKTSKLVDYWQKNLTNPKDTIVSGRNAKTGISYQGTSTDTSPADPSIHSWTTIIDYGSKIYNISASPLNSKKIDIYYQILSTFKFLP